MSSGGGGRGNWRSHELMRLRELFPRVEIRRLAQLLGRTRGSVERQAKVLFARSEPAAIDWSDDEVEILRRAFGVVRTVDIALVLGRTDSDVEAKIDLLRREQREGEWSRGELDLLRQIHGTRSDPELSVCLSRPEGEIREQADRLCLAKDKRVAGGGVRMPRWTSADVARLREMYPQHTNLEIAHELGRSVTSVANKAHQLGLGKSRATLRAMGRRNVAERYRR